MGRVADEEFEAGVEAEAEGDVGVLGRAGRRVRWVFLVRGLVVAAAGDVIARLMTAQGRPGGTTTAHYLVPGLGILGGPWREAVGMLSR
jgi:hypothetical protein